MQAFDLSNGLQGVARLVIRLGNVAGSQGLAELDIFGGLGAGLLRGGNGPSNLGQPFFVVRQTGQLRFGQLTGHLGRAAMRLLQTFLEVSQHRGIGGKHHQRVSRQLIEDDLRSARDARAAQRAHAGQRDFVGIVAFGHTRHAKGNLRRSLLAQYELSPRRSVDRQQESALVAGQHRARSVRFARGGAGAEGAGRGPTLNQLQLHVDHFELRRASFVAGSWASSRE